MLHLQNEVPNPGDFMWYKPVPGILQDQELLRSIIYTSISHT